MDLLVYLPASFARHGRKADGCSCTHTEASPPSVHKGYSCTHTGASYPPLFTKAARARTREHLTPPLFHEGGASTNLDPTRGPCRGDWFATGLMLRGHVCTHFQQLSGIDTDDLDLR
jgi:hypothetical protein